MHRQPNPQHNGCRQPNPQQNLTSSVHRPLLPPCSPSTLEETVAQVLQATTMMASTDQAIESQLPASNLDTAGTYSKYTPESLVGFCSCMVMASCSISNAEAAAAVTLQQEQQKAAQAFIVSPDLHLSFACATAWFGAKNTLYPATSMPTSVQRASAVLDAVACLCCCPGHFLISSPGRSFRG